MIYGATYDKVQPAINAVANFGGTTMPALFDVDLWLAILLFVLIAVTMFYFLERHGDLRRDKLSEGE